MKKSILCILLLITILTTSCNMETNSKYKEDEDKEEISIFCINTSGQHLSTFLSQKILFEQEYDVKVKLESVEVKNAEEYNEALTLMMNKTEGPTLIFIRLGRNYTRFLDAGIAVNLSGKIPNRKNVFKEIITDEYFLPLGVYYPTVSIDREVYKELDLEVDIPDLDWTMEDYRELKKASLDKEPRQLNIWSYEEIFDMFFKGIDLIDEEKNKAKINTKEVKESLKEIKQEVYSGRYILPPNYNYENYKNMLLDYNSEEYKLSRSLYREELEEKLINPMFINALKPKSNNSASLAKKRVVLPDIASDNGKLMVSGFILNRNGKNKELGLELLNYLLSKESQETVLRSAFLYPSIRGFESKMELIERGNFTHQDFIDLRKYTFKNFKKGKYKVGNNISEQQTSILVDLKKISIDYVFRDKPFTEEELNHILIRKEDKYSIWLNE
ncbi:MAG: extracellular solute-binding protein [Firmicutes bacterium]|nr:extracellular solute-binding protein [Bacillota bacterium]